MHLVTGFLGSGKTTFLEYYLECFSDEKRIAVVQNEFSSVNIDSALLSRKKGGYDILEINNGSAFCVCLLGNFIESLATFIKDVRPDEIIMEASGLSDPVSIGQVFHSELLKDKVFLGHVWAIVDAVNFDKMKAIHLRLEHQIRIADFVVVNKCDQPDSKGDAVVESVKKINPFAIVQKTSFARISLTERRNIYKFYMDRIDQNSYKPNLRSIIIKSNKLITRQALGEFIDSVKNDFIRCKGYVNVGENKKFVVQGVLDDYSIEEIDWFPGTSEIICFGSFDNKKHYTVEFEYYCGL